jgi:polar amino acid transport system permease protein
MFLVVLLLLLPFNLAGTGMGDLMRPVIGDPATSGFFSRVPVPWDLDLG